MVQEAVLLIIRRSWVRAPPAPPAVLIPVVGEPWTGLYTAVGEAMFEPSGRIWSHRVAVERVWGTEAYGGKAGLAACVARQEYAGLDNGCRRQLASLA